MFGKSARFIQLFVAFMFIVLLCAAPLRADWCDEFAGGSIDSTKWVQTSGAWTIASGRVTGYWNLGDAQGEQAVLLVAASQVPTGDYTFDADMYVSAGDDNRWRIVLQNSPGNKFMIVFDHATGSISSEVKVASGNYAWPGYSREKFGYFNTSVGSVNSVRVVKQGLSYTFILNGHQLFTLIDTYWGGSLSIGVGAYGYATFERACITTGAPTQDKQKILLYSTRTDNTGNGCRSWDYDEELPRLLDPEGFAVTTQSRYTMPLLNDSILSHFDQWWIVSTYGTGVFVDSELEAFVRVFPNGKSLLTIGDSYGYDAPANKLDSALHLHSFYLASPSGGSIDHCGGGLGCTPSNIQYSSHRIWHNVHSIQTNTSEGSLYVSWPAQWMASHAGAVMVMIEDSAAGSSSPISRAAWETTYYRFTDTACNPGLSIGEADNGRYVANLAHWLYPNSDLDSDGVVDDHDNCPYTYNPDQSDIDGDGAGDVCDSCPSMPGQVCYDVLWQASSHQLPDSSCPVWKRFATNGGETATFIGDTLYIDTKTVGQEGDTLCFRQEAPDMLVPSHLNIEFRMKFISGTRSQTAEGPVGVRFAVNWDTANCLYIGKDVAFLRDYYNPPIQGDTAIFDTDDDFHTYQIRVDSLRNVEVYCDDTLRLTGGMSGSWYPWVLGSRVEFGDLSEHASGQSKWLYLRHNGYPGGADVDFDVVRDSCDNCRYVYNPDQTDLDHNGIGDACEPPFTVAPSGDTADVFYIRQADLDMDNNSDIVYTGATSDSLYIVYGKSDGSLEKPRAYYKIRNGAVTVDYINGDTLLDIVARTTTQVYTLINQGGRSFSIDSLAVSSNSYGFSPTGSGFPSIATGFFNADASKDVVVSPGTILYGNGSGGFSSQSSLSVSVDAVAASDFNGDGYDDVVAAIGDSAKIYLNNGSGTMTRSSALRIGYFSFDVANVVSGIDLNKDGKVDFAVVTGKGIPGAVDTSLISVALGNGSGGIQSNNSIFIEGSAINLAVNDVNRDMNPDLTVVNSRTRSLEVYFGTGQGSFPDSTSYTLGTGSQALLALATADINRDGNPDYLAGGDTQPIVVATSQIPSEDVLPSEMVVTGYGGIDFAVHNPLDFVISQNLRSVAGSAFWRTDINHDDKLDERSFDYNLLNGEYRFVIHFPPYFSGGSHFTMDIRVDGTEQVKPFLNYSLPTLLAASPESIDSLVFYYTQETTPSMKPVNGKRTQSTRQPAFQWGKLVDSAHSTRYQIQVSLYYDLSSLVVNDTALTKPQFVPATQLDTGKVYYWRVRAYNEISWSPWTRTMAAYIGTGCCIGLTGDVNRAGIVDLADLSALVSYLTGGGYTLPCQGEANVNALGIVDLADLSALVAYLTSSGFALPSCP
jgi:hypothetical protein